MTFRGHTCLAAVVSLVASAGVSAQQSGDRSIPGHPSQHVLDVMVSDSSGHPAIGLTKQDFTLLDNAVARPPTSFAAIQQESPSAEVLLVIDAVNTPTIDVGYQREQIEKFLRSNEGHLGHVTTFAVVADQGASIYNGATRDGNALAEALDHEQIGLRQINRSGGFYGANDRLGICLKAMHEIAAFEAKRPGRKLVIWVSPGWPLLSGTEVELDNKQQTQIYKEVIAFSAELQDARITLYDVNSWGVNEPLGRATYYEEFLKPVTKPSQTRLGDLGLQVLAVQSGGLTLNSNDVPGMLQSCVKDADNYYEISFDPAPTEKSDEYRPLQVRVAKSGLTVRTRQGYYAEPGAPK